MMQMLPFVFVIVAAILTRLALSYLSVHDISNGYFIKATFKEFAFLSLVIFVDSTFASCLYEFGFGKMGASGEPSKLLAILSGILAPSLTTGTILGLIRLTLKKDQSVLQTMERPAFRILLENSWKRKLRIQINCMKEDDSRDIYSQKGFWKLVIKGKKRDRKDAIDRKIRVLFERYKYANIDGDRLQSLNTCISDGHTIVMIFKLLDIYGKKGLRKKLSTSDLWPGNTWKGEARRLKLGAEMDRKNPFVAGGKKRITD